jgi:hypothetical protein
LWSGTVSIASNVGGSMKKEVKVEDLKNIMPSSRTTIYFPIVGLQLFMIALLFSHESIMYTLLVLIGSAALTEGFEKSRLQNKLKQIIR